MTPRRVMPAILFMALAAPPVLGQDAAAEEKLQRLIDRIAAGDELEARDATDQLVELVYGPLTRAIGSLEKTPGGDRERSVNEQVRIRQALSRLHAALRVKLLRLDLPEEDRKLLDRFRRDYPDLTEALFHDNYRIRRSALDAIPLDPGTGAGVMICARVDDEDADVAEAALEIAAKFDDPVVARGLTRYVQGATRAVQQGYLKDARDVLEALALIVHKCIDILARSRHPDAVPVVVEAFRTFSRMPQWDALHRARAARRLGEFGDPRVAPALLEVLDSTQEAEFRATPAGASVVQTVGDAALLGLLRLYDLRIEAFGFVTRDEWVGFAGFTDARSRSDAVRRFRIWHEQNAAKPRDQRAAPAAEPGPPPESKPAGDG